MALPRFLLRQLSQPAGCLAPFTALLLNRVNRAANRTAVSHLELAPDDRAMDLGFGGGVALGPLLRAVPRGEVIGVDPSEEMVRRGQRTHRKAIAARRLKLMVGSSERIDVATGSVNGVLTVNTLYFWPDVGRGLAEVKRVLARGGRLVAVVAEQAHCRDLGFVDMGFRTEGPEFYAEAMGDAGFTVSMEDLGQDAILIKGCPQF